MSVIVGIRQLRANLRAYLDRVQAGEEVVITDRGTRIGRIVGPSKLDQLVNEGIVTPAKRPKKPIRVKDLIKIDGPPWPSEMIIEDRKRDRF
jgi:prevent-host-death family protein